MHRQPELVADVLPPEPFEYGAGGSLAADGEDPRVEPRLRSEYPSTSPPATASRIRAPMSRSSPVVVLGGVFRCLGRAQALKRHPDLGDLDGLFERHRADPGAAVLDPLHQPFVGEFHQRVPDARPARAELFGELGFHQPLVGANSPLTMASRMVSATVSRTRPVVPATSAVPAMPTLPRLATILFSSS